MASPLTSEPSARDECVKTSRRAVSVRAMVSCWCGDEPPFTNASVRAAVALSRKRVLARASASLPVLPSYTTVRFSPSGPVDIAAAGHTQAVQASESSLSKVVHSGGDTLVLWFCSRYVGSGVARSYELVGSKAARPPPGAADAYKLTAGRAAPRFCLFASEI